MTERSLVAGLQRVHLLYITLLPGLATAASMLLPGVQPWLADHSTATLFLWMLALAVVAAYLGVSIELMIFPKRLGPAIFATVGIPLQLVVLALLPGTETAGAFMAGFAAECVGLTSYLVALGTHKMFKEDKNWFAYLTLGVVWLGALGFAVVLGRALYSNWAAWSVFASMVASAVFTYRRLMKEGDTNPHAAGWILVGVAAWLVLPAAAIVWVIAF
jgi:hypothetical protein